MCGWGCTCKKECARVPGAERVGRVVHGRAVRRRWCWYWTVACGAACGTQRETASLRWLVRCGECRCCRQGGLMRVECWCGLMEEDSLSLFLFSRTPATLTYSCCCSLPADRRRRRLTLSFGRACGCGCCPIGTVCDSGGCLRRTSFLRRVVVVALALCVLGWRCPRVRARVVRRTPSRSSVRPPPGFNWWMTTVATRM